LIFLWFWKVIVSIYESPVRFHVEYLSNVTTIFFDPLVGLIAPVYVDLLMLILPPLFLSARILPLILLSVIVNTVDFNDEFSRAVNDNNMLLPYIILFFVNFAYICSYKAFVSGFYETLHINHHSCTLSGGL
jgi:hypothetical protein